MSTPKRRSLAAEVLVAAVPPLVTELLATARGVVRREHEAWLALRAAVDAWAAGAGGAGA